MSRVRAQTPEGVGVSLADLILRLSTKMAELSILTVSLQQSVVESLIDPNSQETMADLQRLDRMTQVLQDISTLLAHIGQNVPPGLTLQREVILRGIHRGECRNIVLDLPQPDDQPLAGTVIWL